MAGVTGNGRGFVADINVTPFVDVMLVLLIIFMVTAPMMTEGLEVELPETQMVESLSTDTDHVVLTVKKDGSIFVNETRTGLETLGAVLTITVKAQDKQLFLQADKDVPYGLVVNIMGRVKAAGIAQMGVVAERVDDAAMPPEAKGAPVSSDIGGMRSRGR